METIKQTQHNDTGIVAFAAECQRSFGPNVQNAILPYDRLILQHGCCYSTATFTFTSMIHGLYHFSYSTMHGNRGGVQHGCTYLAKNGVAVDGYANYGNPAPLGYSSKQALVELQVGEEVNIRMGDNVLCSIYYDISHKMNAALSFSGFLVANLEN